MRVHAGAVVSEDGFWHECRDFIVLAGHIADDVLVIHYVVGHLGQWRVLHIDLALTRGADLMVMDFYRYADLLHLQDNFGAEVLQSVRRRYWEISFFVS